jgi:hypothetical protein
MSTELTAEERQEIGEIIEHIQEEGIMIGSQGWKSEWSLKIGKLGGRPRVQYTELAEHVVYYGNNYESLGDVVPSVLGLVVYLGFAEKTFYNIINRMPEDAKTRFVQAISMIKSKNKHSLQNKALKGETKERITMFLLNINHGMVEQTQQNISVNGSLSLKNATSRDIIDITENTNDVLEF